MSSPCEATDCAISHSWCSEEVEEASKERVKRYADAYRDSKGIHKTSAAKTGDI